MLSWLAPFTVALFIAILYFFAGGRGSNSRGRAMQRDINFYMVCILITAVVAILANWNLDSDWKDAAAWVVAVLAIAVAVFRFRSNPEPEVAEKTDKGPLERASDKNGRR